MPVDRYVAVEKQGKIGSPPENWGILKGDHLIKKKVKWPIKRGIV